jgi:predicted small lipoprotein YifL
MMNNCNRYIVLAMLLLALQACGLKGDLYLENPESEATETDNTRKPLPPMPELETSMDDTGAGVAEDMETMDGLASPEDADEPEDDNVLGDAPIAP